MTPQVVTARAPCRVDLAGGTLDIWPIGLLHPGARTVNFAIDLRVEVSVKRTGDSYVVRQSGSRRRGSSLVELQSDPATALVGLVGEHFHLPPAEITIKSASPRGAGLGASSALTVALIVAFERLMGKRRSEPRDCVHLARDIEARLMALPTGTQDHYPALLGGVLEIVHEMNRERHRSVLVDLDRLDSHLSVLFTGESHLSAQNNWQIYRRRLDGERQSRDLFAGITQVASTITKALSDGDFEQVGALMSQEWTYRRRLSDSASTQRIEELLDLALQGGAWGGKACGAGGGGCVAILGPAEGRSILRQELVKAGGQLLHARPTADGLEVDGC